jgi:hypothetical protein
VKAFLILSLTAYVVSAADCLYGALEVLASSLPAIILGLVVASSYRALMVAADALCMMAANRLTPNEFSGLDGRQ